MKKIIISSILWCTLLQANVTNIPLHGKTFFLTRSQSVNAARDLAGWHRPFPLCTNQWRHSFTVTPEYTHSFRPDQIAEYFFGTPYLQISGSEVPNRGYYDILADYFGLSQTYQSTVYLQPMLQNALADLRYHVGYNDWYMHIHAPVVWARSEIQITECIGSSTPFEALYMAPGAVTPVVSTFCQAVSQGAVYGEVTEPLQFGRFGPAQSTTKLSEIQVAVGNIFLKRPNGWMSLNLRGSIPTGTRPDSKLLFEPIVGNGHHGELGIGFYGQGLLWQKDEDLSISLWLEANFTHLFGNTQCRSFDLCPACNPCTGAQLPINGFGSRYVLAKEFDATGTYIQSCVPLINRTTLPCKVSVDIQVDVAVMFAFDMGNWTYDIGYDGWIRSRERISLLQCLPAATIGLKGIQNVALGIGGPSNVTQSTATLHGNAFSEQAMVADAQSPVFVTSAQINTDSGASSRMLTHKFFMHGQHTWHRFSNSILQPFFGVGFEVEFEGNRPKDLQPNKNGLSQWGIWLKGGLGY